jgi:hypothetical protein
MITLGCPQVTCGRKMVYKDYLYQKNILKYIFQIENNQITYKTKDNNNENNQQSAPKERTDKVLNGEKR